MMSHSRILRMSTFHLTARTQYARTCNVTDPVQRVPTPLWLPASLRPSQTPCTGEVECQYFGTARRLPDSVVLEVHLVAEERCWVRVGVTPCYFASRRDFMYTSRLSTRTSTFASLNNSYKVFGDSPSI